MTWEVSEKCEYWGPFTYDYEYKVSNGTIQFKVFNKEDAEWLCTTLEDYDTLKKKLDSLSRSVLCDNLGNC